MIQKWMSVSVTMKPTKNLEILGQTDITARHLDTQEMIRHTGNLGIPAIKRDEQTSRLNSHAGSRETGVAKCTRTKER